MKTQKHIIQKLTVAVILLLLSLPASAEVVKVIVSVIPQKHFVEKIGGDRVEVSAMVKPDHNPELYEPTPRQIEELASARVYLTIGVPFEDRWLDSITDAHPNLQVVNGIAGIELMANELHNDSQDDHDDHDSHSHRDDHDEPDDDDHNDHEAQDMHDHGEFDPHVWTDPALVQKMIVVIRDALIQIDPDGARLYKSNYNSYYKELERLDENLVSILKNLPSRQFVIYHPAWGYFAERYGLEQVAVEFEGKEPSTRQLSKLVRRVQKLPTKTVFYQPQHPAKIANRIAEAMDGRAVSIDPLAEDYEANLIAVAREIRKAMQ